jgi:ribulose-bisphosphate carboxylase large chain
MKYEDYVDLNYRPNKDDLICEFFVESEIDLKKAAGGVAAESSIGTWAETSTEKPYVRKLAAKVFSIKKLGNKSAMIKIAYPIGLFELDNIPNFMSSVAGNIFGLRDLKNLRLEDMNLPTKMIKKFKGPVHGISGIRKLVKVKNRPLVGTIIKPKLGLKTVDHAKVAYNAWIGGCDIVKDDENLSSQTFNRFETRLKTTLKARDRAERETGERKMYMINVTAETNEMLRRAKLARDYGNEYMMVDIVTVGWSALQTLRNYNEKLKLVMHAHRASHAAFTRNPKHGISMMVIAKIARLIGMDQLHIGTIFGKMEGPKQEVLSLDQEIEKQIIKGRGTVLSEKWYNIKPMFAVCSGGLHPALIPKLVKNLGNDIIIQMGGGIHAHPQGTKAGAMAARQAADASMKNISLKEYSKKHKELRLAMEKWGNG